MAAGSKGVWTQLSDCASASPLEITEGERSSQMVVEVHTDQGLQAKGVIPVDALWQVLNFQVSQCLELASNNHHINCCLVAGAVPWQSCFDVARSPFFSRTCWQQARSFLCCIMDEDIKMKH